MTMQKIILIAGPTASGKSRRAMELAQAHHGTIINADALQIYSSLPILSAQPSANDYARQPHRLYGLLDPTTPSSAGIWLTLALDAITTCITAKTTPIIVGGTGLYFRTLLGGLADIPDIPATVRHETSALYDRLGETAFRQELAETDPLSAQRLARNDRQRLIRAYEVVRHTGQPIHHWHTTNRSGITLANGVLTLPDLPPLQLCCELLIPPRDDLYARCNARLIQMIDAGARDEVRALIDKNIPITAPVMNTIGAKELAAHLTGSTSLDHAIAAAQQATRHYVKRQMTWFRHQWPKTIGVSMSLPHYL